MLHPFSSVLFSLLCCGCHPWGFTQTFPSNFECTVNLLHAHFATHHSLLIFLVSSCNVLSTPPSTSVSGQHTIGFLPTIVILIICFLCFSFGYFFRFCLYLLFFSITIFLYVFFCLFLLFGCFSIVAFLFLCTFFSFLFLLVIRLYPLKLFSAHEYICIWSRSLGCGCQQYSGFRVEEDEYWLRDLFF
jgi:hypothetical protein